MSDIKFTKENNLFLINTNFESSNIVKLQGIKPSFFYDNLSSNNYIELNVNNEAVAPFFNKITTLVSNFESNNANNRLYIGLYFIEINSTEKSEIEKAPLLLVPVSITKETELFKLKMDSTLSITTNPFLTDSLSLNGVALPPFSEFNSLMDYLDAVHGICDAKDYLLKNLSILGSAEVVTAIQPDHIEITKASEQVEVQFQVEEQSTEELFTTSNNTNLEPNIVESTSKYEQINVPREDYYIDITELVSQETDVNKFAKVSMNQKETQLSSLQIHPLAKVEKEILFNVKNGESLRITKNIKSNTLPFISNLILLSLVQNKKVLYLSNNKNSVRNLQKQIIRDGFENFVLAVDETEILNNINGLFDNINMEATFDANELKALIDSKKSLRIELNDYLKTNHKVFEHMNLTLFDVIQKIISIKEESNISKTYPIHIPNITELSPLDLHRYTFHLNSYVKYFEASKIALENTFWKNIDFSVAQKSDLTKIEGTLGELKTILEHLKTENNTIISSTIGYNTTDVKTFYNLYTNLNSDIFSTDYVYNLDQEAVISSVNKLYNLQNSFSEYKEDIFKIFNEDIFSSDILLLNNNLDKNIKKLISILGNEKYESKEELIQNLESIQRNAKTFLDYVEDAFNIGETLSNHFSLTNCRTIQELRLLIEMFSFALEDVRINDLWFNELERTNFINNTYAAVKLQDEIKLNNEKILENYKDDILSVDFESLNKQLALVKDTKTDPVATKIYRYLKSYRNDISSDVNYDDTTVIINDLREYYKKTDAFKALLSKMLLFYNKPLSLETDFDLARKNISIFEETLVAFDYEMPEAIRTFLLDPTSLVGIYDEFKLLRDLVTNKISNLKDFNDLQDLSKEELINTLNSIVTSADESSYIYNKIISYVKPDVSSVTISQISEVTGKILSLIEVQDEFENLYQVTSKKIPDHLTSYEIDLESITTDLEVFKKLRRLLCKFGIEEVDFYDFAKTIRQEILSNTQRYNYLIDEAIELFKTVFDFANNTCEVCQDFEKDLQFVTTLQSDFALAKQGYLFARSNEECVKLELSEFLQSVEEDNLSANKIIDAFLISFYTEWLKETLNNANLKETVDYLEVHNKMNQYFELSEKIYLYNKSALYAEISEKMPRLTTNKSSLDEVNTLLQEIKPNKETNFKTIFNKVPNLIFEIKPCLLTTFDDFKELKTYNQLHFDLVIVDDANKISYDLSGKNICAKQTIILGDLYTKHVENNFFTSPGNKLINYNLNSIQRRFNHSLAKFLNLNYFDKSLFVPYTKNFDLDLKNEFVEGTLKDNVNEAEAFKVITLLQEYYSAEGNKKNKAQILALTEEQKVFINNLILTDEILSPLLESKALILSTLEELAIKDTNLTILTLCATDLMDLVTFTSKNNHLENIVTLLLNTINSLYIVESISLLSKLMDENWNEVVKLLFKLVQQFVSTDEMYEIELQKNTDIFTTNLVNHFSTDFNINYTSKNHYNNIYINEKNSVRLLLQTDPFINNKTDFEDIYLKQHFTEVIDGVKIVNVLGYSWHLSTDYKTFIQNEIENKLTQNKATSNELLLKPVVQPEESGNFFNLVPYEQADLYEIEPVNDITVFVANAITHIVRVESPIHVDLVHEKLISILGSSNSTFNLDEIIGQAFKAYLKDIVVIKDDFYWNTSNMVTQPRVPTNLATTRYISHIALEELSAILYEIIKKSYGIRFDSLVTACCKELGFTSQSLSIKNKISTAYEQLLQDNKIININNKLKAN